MSNKINPIRKEFTSVHSENKERSNKRRQPEKGKSMNFQSILQNEMQKYKK